MALSHPLSFLAFECLVVVSVQPTSYSLLAGDPKTSSPGKDMLKSSFHLVWPQLVVDPDSAPLIRELTLIVFKEKTNQKAALLDFQREP